MRGIFLLCVSALMWSAAVASPVDGLLERIDPGASRKFETAVVQSDTDFFELDWHDGKVVVRGNNYVSIATGVNWYLKYYAGIHLSWNGMQAQLPDTLPVVRTPERHATALRYRYDFNYCTYSYSMAFWDWDRWEQEIDWMALHGINLPLALTGTEAVWRNVLLQLGYSEEEVGKFVAGSGFQAWWLMNNLEGWGGPNPQSWYDARVKLQQRILNRMREFGIDPVLPGYAGMVPHDAKEKLGLRVADPGKWCGFTRPAFLQPADPAFQRIAGLYYAEMEKLYGKARFYSMDPFHEGGNTKGVNLAAAGKSIVEAMKRANPEAVWVIQGWQANPRREILDAVEAGDMLVLDLSSENRPMWGDKDSPWYREEGYDRHDWLYCMLLNFGGNVGMYGRMDRLINGFYDAKAMRPATLRGVGMTMEGIENNPVMYELLTELPWRPERFKREDWVRGYVKARYGRDDRSLQQVWRYLSGTVYNCPDVREGTVESVLCARPAEEVTSVSTWGSSKMYYSPKDTEKAAMLMVWAADSFVGNNNFEYDLVDILRQAIADRGNGLLKVIMAAYGKGDKAEFKRLSDSFLHLIDMQDELLATRPEFKVGTWLAAARKLGQTPEEKRLYEWNARVQITTWGNREAAEVGKLHDYSHREWAGLLRDFYKPRWKRYFDVLERRMGGETVEGIDWYAEEEPWTLRQNSYSEKPEGKVATVARWVYVEVFR